MNSQLPSDQMSKEQLARFDEASNHPYECRCTICQEWWELCGPEPEGDDCCVHGVGFDEECEDCQEEIEDTDVEDRS